MVSRSISQSKSNKDPTIISTNDGNRRQGNSEGEKIRMGVEKRPSGCKFAWINSGGDSPKKV